MYFWCILFTPLGEICYPSYLQLLLPLIFHLDAGFPNPFNHLF